MEAARAAIDEDVAAIAVLARQATKELTPGRGGSVWSRREARFEPIGPLITAAVADDQAVVGTIDEVIVGYGIMVTETLHDDAILAVVDDIYVEPEARGVGVGEAIMDLLLERAKALDAVGIDAMALPGDRATKNFFERYGLTARAIVVHRSLDQDTKSDRP